MPRSCRRAGGLRAGILTPEGMPACETLASVVQMRTVPGRGVRVIRIRPMPWRAGASTRALPDRRSPDCAGNAG